MHCTNLQSEIWNQFCSIKQSQEINWIIEKNCCWIRQLICPIDHSSDAIKRRTCSRWIIYQWSCRALKGLWKVNWSCRHCCSWIRNQRSRRMGRKRIVLRCWIQYLLSQKERIWRRTRSNKAKDCLRN